MAVTSPDEPSSSSTQSLLPMVQIDAPGDVVTTLLKLCYPSEPEADIPNEPAHLLQAIAAADQYEMKRPAQMLQDRWEMAAKGAPLKAFLLATCYRNRGCARTAAKYILEEPFQGVYDPLMERSPAVPYHCLLIHYRSCREIATSMLSDVTKAAFMHYGNPRGRRYDPPYYPHSDSYHSRGPTPIVIVDPHQYHHGYEVPSEERTTLEWLKAHVAQLSSAIGQRPGRAASTTEELVEAASHARKWCGSCAALASDLCDIGRVLREIPTKVKAVRVRISS